MRALSVAVLALAVLAAPSASRAEEPDAEARRIFKEGVASFRAGDYLQALESYEKAYALFPSPKILLNMGTCLRQLGRRADAADAYERYLADPGADPKRKNEVTKILGELDGKVGRIAIRTTAGATVLVDGKQIALSDGQATIRVEPGSHIVAANKDGLDPAVETVDIAAGEHKTLALQLKAPQVEAPPVATPAPARPAPAAVESVALDEHRQFGALVRADVDGKLRGALVAVGVAWAPSRIIEINGAALIGENSGFYAGGALSYPRTAIRPLLSLGVPVYFVDGVDGPKPGFHGALGVRWDASPRFSFSVDAGLEHIPDLPPMFEPTFLVSSVGMRVFL